MSSWEKLFPFPTNALLQIPVENTGRINYEAVVVHSHKGIISPVFIDSIEIKGGWEMQGFPFEKEPNLAVLKNVRVLANSNTTAAKIKETLARVPAIS